MTHKFFYNNAGFRIAAPIIAGLFLYFLILMFFDSVDMILSNFFSREVFFVIVLTYVIFEANRLIIVILNRVHPVARNIRIRFMLQYVLAILINLTLVSLILQLYFVYIEGFTTIVTELITFNALFCFTVLFYHLFFFSIVYLNRRNDSLVEQEIMMKESIEIELQSFKNEINPKLLFQSLEIIISALHRDKKHAEKLIDQLSLSYRYILDNRFNELATLKDEIQSIHPIMAIFKSRHHDAFRVLVDIKDVPGGVYLIPGTLSLILEFALAENIITEAIPLNMTISLKEPSVIVTYKINEKVAEDNPVAGRLRSLTKAYAHFHPVGMIITTGDGIKQYEIPLLVVEEE